MSEANKDEALRCLSIAQQALKDGDLQRAEKFGHKSLRLYRTEGVSARRAGGGSCCSPGGGRPRTTEMPAENQPRLSTNRRSRRSW
jgi:hypothetical protein